MTLWTTFSGSGTGNSNKAKVAVDIPIQLVAGKNIIDLLSLTVGLQVCLYFLCCIQECKVEAILVYICFGLLIPPHILSLLHQTCSLATSTNTNLTCFRTMEPFLTHGERGSLVPWYWKVWRMEALLISPPNSGHIRLVSA